MSANSWSSFPLFSIFSSIPPVSFPPTGSNSPSWAGCADRAFATTTIGYHRMGGMSRGKSWESFLVQGKKSVVKAGELIHRRENRFHAKAQSAQKYFHHALVVFQAPSGGHALWRFGTGGGRGAGEGSVHRPGTTFCRPPPPCYSVRCRGAL